MEINWQNRSLSANLLLVDCPHYHVSIPLQTRMRLGIGDGWSHIKKPGGSETGQVYMCKTRNQYFSAATEMEPEKNGLIETNSNLVLNSRSSDLDFISPSISLASYPT